jgi:hypothetical protein
VAVPTCPFEATEPEARPRPPRQPSCIENTDTVTLGTRVGPVWRLVTAPNEDKVKNRDSKCFLTTRETAEYIKRGMASWSDEDDGDEVDEMGVPLSIGILTWRPKWILPDDGPEHDDDWDDISVQSCVWRSFTPVRVDTEGGAVLRMLFRTQVRGGNTDMDLWVGKPGESSLRNPGGTGDFRVTLWKTNGEDPAKWQGFQYRLNPLMHVKAFLTNHKGKGDSSNVSASYRYKPGHPGCMTDDCCQTYEDNYADGRSFDKLSGKVTMGPHSPPCEWVEVIFRLRKLGNNKMSADVSVNGNNMGLGEFEYETKPGLEGTFDSVDAISWGFTNARPYHHIQLWCDNF